MLLTELCRLFSIKWSVYNFQRIYDQGTIPTSTWRE